MSRAAPQNSMAEDVVDGICCANCMTLFTKAHGYPVICRSCAPSFSKAELKETGYQIATEREA